MRCIYTLDRLKIRTLILLLGLCAPSKSFAQVANEDMIWLRYWANFQLGERFQFSAQATNQNYQKPWKERQIISHYLASYKVNDILSPGIGLTYANVWNHSSLDQSLFLLPEIRPFQELQIRNNWSKKWKQLSRVRVDERFVHRANAEGLAKGFDYQGRVRFQSILQFRANTRLGVRVGDELFVNFNKDEFDRHLGQNRIFTGLNVELRPNLSVDSDFFLISKKAAVTSSWNTVYRIGLMSRFERKKNKL